MVIVNWDELAVLGDEWLLASGWFVTKGNF